MPEVVAAEVAAGCAVGAVAQGEGRAAVDLDVLLIQVQHTAVEAESDVAADGDGVGAVVRHILG